MLNVGSCDGNTVKFFVFWVQPHGLIGDGPRDRRLEVMDSKISEAGRNWAKRITGCKIENKTLQMYVLQLRNTNLN